MLIGVKLRGKDYDVDVTDRLDYAEPVKLKGSPARRGARSLTSTYEPARAAPSRGIWDRTGVEPRWSQAHDVLVRDALNDWKGDTAMMVLHMQDEEAGAAMPGSGSGKIARARAAALLCARAIPQFETRGGGRIINISSRAAFRGDQPDYIAYAASKGGMVALTRSIARGFGKQGVVAFNVAPGFTRTAMAQDFIDQYGEDYAVSDIALTRLTEPKDIAPTVVFLASGLADHATGATIDINAGSYVH